MEQAKAAIVKLTSRRGHFTDVTETLRPAVTVETIKPTRHEIITQAVDKEVHQHHYHTTVQPLSHSETLPAIHTHNPIAVEHRVFRHDNEEETKRRLTREMARFVDVSVTAPTIQSQSSSPPVIGEHVHHHIHETVQPIIYKETIMKETVHTTVPIHEIHHNQSVHHTMSALPLVAMEEFTSRGGVLTGSPKNVCEHYDGAPRKYNDKLYTTFEKLGLAPTGAAATAPVMKKRHHRRDNSDSGVDGVSSSESDSDTSLNTRQRNTHRSLRV